MEQQTKLPRGQAGQVVEVVLSNPGKRWTPERIKEARPTLTLSHETIGHALRRARRKGIVNSELYVGTSGQKIAEYFAPEAPAAPVDYMVLPEGKTCGVCAHFNRCEMLFQCRPSSSRCDWSPSRFVEPRLP